MQNMKHHEMFWRSAAALLRTKASSECEALATITILDQLGANTETNTLAIQETPQKVQGQGRMILY